MRYPYFVNGSNELDVADAQRTLNLMPEIVGPAGKSKGRLIGTPGMTLLKELVSSKTSVRGIFEGDQDTEAYFFAAVDDHLYKVATADGSVSDLGSIGNDSNHTPISYATGGPDLDTLIVSNGVAYSLISGALAAVSELSGITCYDCCYINGYWIVVVANGMYQRSAVGDLTSWDALDYDYPDTIAEPLVGCAANNGQVWFFGQTRTNIWIVDASTDIGFAPLQGVVIQEGCHAKATIKILDRAIVWLSRIQDGVGKVVAARSYSPQRLSTHYVEDMLTDNASTLSTAYAVTMEERGHEIYMLSVPGASSSVCYDASTQQWHERAYGADADGLHLAKCHYVKSGVHYVGARNSGSVYTMSAAVFTDSGTAIKRLRRAPHITNEDKPVRYSTFRLDIEKGLGADGSAPLMYLRYSNNGGKTYSTAIGSSIGETDDDPNTIKVEWHRLGTGDDYVFEVYTTAAHRMCITDAYIN